MELSYSTPKQQNADLKLESGKDINLAKRGDIFDLEFNDLRNSPTYRYLRHGFEGTKDFEDFKQELVDFQRLKRELGEDSLDFELTHSPTRRKASTRRNNLESSANSQIVENRLKNNNSDELQPNNYQNNNRFNSNSSEIKEVHPAWREFEDFETAINLRKQASRDLEDFEWKHHPKRIHIRETSRLPPVPRISSREYLAYKLPNSPLCRRRSRANDDYSDILNLCSSLNPSENGDRLEQRQLQEDFRDFQISNLTGLLSRRRRDKTNMDSPTVDDHFQEFERVYETIHNHKNSSELDLYKNGHYGDDLDRWSSNRTNGLTNGKSKRPSSRFSSNSSLNDVFSIDFDDAISEFFDTDEDFVEFEREFERVRFRRSRALTDFKRMSSCDIFSDVKSFCDRSKRESMLLCNSDKTPEIMSPNDLDTGQDRALEVTEGVKLRDTTNANNMWNSLEDWDYVLNKLKRNSRLFTTSDYSGFEDLGVGGSLPSKGKLAARGLCNCNNPTDCQYTCHHTCVPSVTLDCTSVSPTEVPSTPDGSAAETSLSGKHTGVSPRPQIPQILEEKVSSDTLSCDRKEDNVNSDQSETSPLLPPLTDGEQTLEPSHENDETDSGYRSGTIPDEKLPKHKGEATLNREELKRKLDDFNDHVPSADFRPDEGGETFQGFLKVTLNFIRPITMSLGVRPPSIYEMLTKEHIVEQNTQSIAFYMPRDTVKSIHTSSTTTTKEVIAGLLKKFHIIDHPRKFAMYEQEFDGHKIVKLRRVTDKEFPLTICLNWDTSVLKRYRLVLQENETGEIVWDGFCLPELNNFLIVLEREENEYISQLQYKYKVMRRIITQRLKELRKERRRLSGATSPTGSSSPSTPGSSAAAEIGSQGATNS